MRPPFLKAILLRFTLYTLLIFIFTASLPFLVGQGDIDVFKEGGFIEWLQFFILILTSCTFLACRFVVAPAYRHLLILLASLPAMAAIREQDALLDNLIPVFGWKVGFLILIYPLGLAWKNKTAIREQLESFLSTRSFAILWAGFIVAIPFSQMVGHGDFLKILMGDDYLRDYKRVIEETGEFLGYFLLLIGSFEAFLEMRRGGNSRGIKQSIPKPK